MIYDVILIGSSPITMLEAACLSKKGLNVLLIEKRERLGGAWSTIDLQKAKEVEENCHLLIQSKESYKVMEEHLLWDMISMDPQPQFVYKTSFYKYNSPLRFVLQLAEHAQNKEKSKTGNFSKLNTGKKSRLDQLRYVTGLVKEITTNFAKTNYKYPKGGVKEMTSKLSDMIVKRGGKLTLNTKVMSINIYDNSLDVLTSKALYKTKKVILTQGSDLSSVIRNTQSIELINKRKKSYQFYLLVDDPEAKEISYLRVFFNSKLFRVSEISKFSDIKKYKLFCVQLRNTFVTDDKKAMLEDIIIELKRLNILSSKMQLIESDLQYFDAVYKTSEDIENILQLSENRIQFLPIRDLSRSILSNYKKYK